MKFTRRILISCLCLSLGLLLILLIFLHVLPSLAVAVLVIPSCFLTGISYALISLREDDETATLSWLLVLSNASALGWMIWNFVQLW